MRILFICLWITLIILLVRFLAPKPDDIAYADSNKLIIAIIDTGYDKDLAISATYPPLKLCPDGHYDFNSDRPIIESKRLHGTIVGSIIASKLQDVKYCALIYQIYDTNGINISSIIRAFRMATGNHAKFINYSVSGTAYYTSEKKALENAANNGIKIFVPAGNSNYFLNINCREYPICYEIPGITSVGALLNDRIAYYSNYGFMVNEWYPGSVLWKNKIEQGTSYAVPRALSAYALEYAKQHKLMIQQQQ